MLQVQSPFQQFFDLDGSPLEDGRVFIGVTGQNPETNLVAIYWDEAGTIPAAQPLKIQSGYIYRSGSPARVYVGVDDYSMLARNKKGVLIYSVGSVTSVANLRQELADQDGSSMIGFIQAGTGAVARTAEQKMREVEVNIMDYGAVVGLAADSLPAIQEAIDYVFGLGGGTVKMPPGDFLLGGSSFVNVKQNVALVGSGYATRLVSESGGKSANYNQISIKDFAEVRDFRISGSDYMGSRDLVNGTPWNKVGVSTQGAATGQGVKVKNIGFEKIQFSFAYVFDGHHDIEISGNYTFGQQVGQYADLAGDGLVLDWNADSTDGQTPTKIANGTRVYAITNFHNSGTGAYNVDIFNNKLKNINDAMAAPNTNAYRHNIFNNHFEKTETGYYGGYGIDFNGCYECQAWGNTIVGASFGALFHDGAYRNKAFGNVFKTAHGVGQFNAARNKAFGNEIILSKFGVTARGIGPGAGLISAEASSRFSTSDNDIRPANIDTTVTTISVTGCASSGALNRIRVTVTSHGLVNRAIVEISGVTGTTEANGVWQVSYIDADTLDLLSSTFTNAYVSGGSCVFARNGVGIAVPDGGGASSMVNRDGYINDLGIGLITGNNGSINDVGVSLVNIPSPRRGNGTLTNNLLEVTGLSSSGVAARNFSGTAVIVAGTTTTTVTFAKTETDANYRIVVSNNNQDLGLYWTNKTTAGFTLNHTSPAFNREANWIIAR